MHKLGNLLKPAIVRFDEAGHTYTNILTNELYTGCTTIAGSLEKDFMGPWHAKEAVKELGYFDPKEIIKGIKIKAEREKALSAAYEKLQTQFGNMSMMDGKQLWTVLESAKFAAKRKADTAKDNGTKAHALQEQYVLAHMTGTEMAELEFENKEIENAYNAFIGLLPRHKIEWLAVEEVIASEAYKIAGKLDNLESMDGIPTLLDRKTSGQISESYFLQLAGYHIMLSEMGFPPRQWCIWRTPKDGTEGEEIIVSDLKEMQFFQETFLHLREAHKYGVYLTSHYKDNKASGPILIPKVEPVKQAA